MKSGIFGYLEVTSIDKAGNRFKYATPNTLTNEASRISSHALVGHDLTNLAVTKFGVGDTSVAPTRADTNLGNLVHQQDVDTITFPEPGQVEFKTVLEFLTSANGFTLTEAGLYSLNGTTLFARQVHTQLPKDENFRLEYVWRIVFT